MPSAPTLRPFLPSFASADSPVFASVAWNGRTDARRGCFSGLFVALDNRTRFAYQCAPPRETAHSHSLMPRAGCRVRGLQRQSAGHADGAASTPGPIVADPVRASSRSAPGDGARAGTWRRRLADDRRAERVLSLYR